MDRLPSSYFASLPYADGVTRGKPTLGVGAPPFSDTLIAAAKQADAAIGADDDYCASVARVGTSVNTAVHAFKLAWNATQAPVPINTGNYEVQTAEALYLVLGEAFEPCPTRTAARPTPIVVQPPQPKSALSTGDLVGYGLLGAGALGGAVYLVTKPRRQRR